MDIVEIILKTLADRNWGIYHKSKPIHTLSIQEGSPLFAVNEVDEEHVEIAIEETISEKESEWTKSSQTNSQQNPT